MMGLFEDAGIDASDLDLGLSDGQHPAVISKITERQPGKKDPSVFYQVWEYTTPDHDYPIMEFFQILPEGKRLADCDDTDDSFNVYENPRTGKTVKQTELNYFRGKYRQLKSRMVSVGVPEDKINAVSSRDLINTPVTITTKRRGAYANIVDVVVPGAAGVSLPSRSAGATSTDASASDTASATTAPAGSNPFAR
jgi:hypothetical protein